MEFADKQIILMNQLLEEMVQLRHRFDELQGWEFSDPAVRDAAGENLKNDVQMQFSGRKDAMEPLLKSFAKIQNLIEEVQHSVRASSHDAM
jgi:hypothetical protein